MIGKRQQAKGHSRAARGFTMVESLVAVTLLTISVVAPMTLTTMSLSSAYYARDQITAFHLAQEAIESVRHIRDGNILNIALGNPANVFDGIPITGEPFTIDARSDTVNTSACSFGCPPLLLIDGLYGYGTGDSVTTTRFTRTVRANPVPGNSDEFKVEVTISWKTGSFNARSFTISENMYRWVKDGSAAL